MPVHTRGERAKKGIARGTAGRIRKAVRRKPGAKRAGKAALKRALKRKGK